MVKNNDNDLLQASKERREQLKKYGKAASTSMLAITMGMNWNPAHLIAAGPPDSAELNPATAPVQYTGNSLAYFKNVFLPNSGYQAMSDGEHAPTASNVAVSGTAKSGSVLTGSYVYQDAENHPETGTTFQWYRSDDAGQTINFVQIPGAIFTSYTLTAADVGKYITFTVTPRTTVAPAEGIETKSAATSAVAAESPPAALPSPPAGSQPAPAETEPEPAPTQEEVLIEVVAVKENVETIDSAKLFLTRDNEEISLARFHFYSDGVIRSSENANPKETIAVRARSLTNAKTVFADIAGDAIASLQSKRQRLAVLTGDVAIEFPAESIPLDDLVRQSGLAADKLTFEIRIEKQPETVKTQAQEWAGQRGASIVGEPYRFSLQANDGTQSVPIVQYGNRYAYHTIPVPAGVTRPKSLGAVMLIDGKYVPVPVRILDSGQALIHAPTNATVMLVQREERFADAAAHWGEYDIHLLADKGHDRGDGQGNYAPNAKITRAEFARLLVDSFGLGHQDTGAQGPEFDDLPADEAVRNSILIAAGDGLFKGVGPGRFAPDQEITREQMISVLMRFFQGFELETNSPADPGTLPAFSDMDRTSDWAAADMLAAYDAGIVSGYENATLRPLDNGTRAEAATLIRRFMQKTGLIN